MRRYWPLLLFVSALAVRMIGLGAESFWYDETFTAQLAQLPLPHLIQATAGDVHPPAFYLISWVIAHLFGHSEFWLRVPAALFSAGSVTEIYLLIRQTMDHRAGLWAAGLTLIAGGMQYYGQEARMYSMLTWLVLVSLRSVLEDRKWRFGPAMALSLYSHNLAAVYFLPLAGLALWKWRKQALLPLALAGGSYLPWLGVLINQLRGMSGGYWIAQGGIGGLIYYWIYGTFGTRMPAWATLHTWIASIAMTIASLYALRKDISKHLHLLAITSVPPLELFGISALWHPMMLPRGLLPSSAGILALWGLGIYRMNKQARTFAALILIPMMLLTLFNYFTDPSVQRLPASEQVEIIQSHWQPGDTLYHTTIATPVSYGYYLPGYDYFILPGWSERGGLTPQTRDALGLTPHEAPIETLAARGYKRAYLIYATGSGISDQQVAESNHILKEYPVLSEWTIVDTPVGSERIYLIGLR